MASHTHERTRRDHATELAEDYVEAIDDIISHSGVCRAMDLVKHFQVTHATVSNAVGRLVELFLRKLGVSKEAARIDSEGIEHHVGKETLDAMQRVLTEGWPLDSESDAS